MSKTIHIVCARAGMYSDSTEWNVAAYADKATAEEHARKAQERANELSRATRSRPSASRPRALKIASDFAGLRESQ